MEQHSAVCEKAKKKMSSSSREDRYRRRSGEGDQAGRGGRGGGQVGDQGGHEDGQGGDQAGRGGYQAGRGGHGGGQVGDQGGHGDGQEGFQAGRGGYQAGQGGGYDGRPATPPRPNVDFRFSTFEPSPVLQFANDFTATTNTGRMQLRDTQRKWSMVRSDLNQLQERMQYGHNPADLARQYPSESLNRFTAFADERQQDYQRLMDKKNDFDDAMNQVTNNFERLSYRADNALDTLHTSEYSRHTRDVNRAADRMQPRRYNF